MVIQNIGAWIALFWCCLCLHLQAEDDGLVLITPFHDREAVLLDAETGKELHTWKNYYYNAGTARLQADGSLLRVIEMTKDKTFEKAGIQGGGLELVEPDGKLRWRLWLAGTFEMNAVDALVLPNGNILAIMLEWKSKDEMLRAGRNPELVDAKGVLVPALVELKVRGLNVATPVWRWTLWDHLYQTRDQSLPNFQPEFEEGCIDIASGLQKRDRKWLIPIGLSYNAENQLIALSVQGFSEPWLIDHSTTSEEASSSAGGKRRRGGRILNAQAAVNIKHNDNGNVFYSTGAIWSTESQGVKPTLYTTGASKDTRSISSYLVATTGALNGGSVLFDWNVNHFNKTVSNSDLNPTAAVLAAAGKLLVIEKTKGRLALVDLQTGKQVWKYSNSHGSRKIDVTKGGCCGDGQQPNDTSKPAREISPVRSVFYYPAGYLAVRSFK